MTSPSGWVVPTRYEIQRSMQATRTASAGRATWSVPGAQSILVLIPVSTQSPRVLEIAGGPYTLPVTQRTDVVPAPVGAHIITAAVYVFLGLRHFSARKHRGRPNWHRAAPAAVTRDRSARRAVRAVDDAGLHRRARRPSALGSPAPRRNGDDQQHRRRIHRNQTPRHQRFSIRRVRRAWAPSTLGGSG